MEKVLRDIINQKIKDCLSDIQEVKNLVSSLDKLSKDNKSFAYGIIIGRLYNSFYYQCRRVLKRDPTHAEFKEFLEILKSQESKILKKLA